MRDEKPISWSWTLLLLAIPLLGIAVGFYWLDGLLPDRGWAIPANDRWQIVSTGWPLLLDLWPVLLAGALLGLLVGFAIAAYSAIETTKMDLVEREENMSKHEASINTNLEYIKTQRDEFESNRIEHLVAVQQRERVAEETISKANQMVTQARIQIEDAETRRINATATAERRKKKIDKLNAKLAQF